MDLLTDSDIKTTDSGCHVIPESVLDRLHTRVKLDASAAYAEIIAKYPDYHISMVLDGDLRIYWTKIA